MAVTYEKASSLLPESLRVRAIQKESDERLFIDAGMRALQAILLGFMRSTVTNLGTQMPFPLSDVRRLTSKTPESARYFASTGLMGGFLLKLEKDETAKPYIASEYWSRQWGAHTIRHKITTDQILKVNAED